MFQSRSLTRGPIRTTTPFFIKTCNISPKFKRVSHFGVPMPRGARLKLTTPTCLGTGHEIPVAEAAAAEAAQSFPSSTSPVISPKKKKVESFEENIEKVIYRCRFLAILGVLGSLVGSFLCFIKGCTYVVSSFMEYSLNRAKVIILLVEAIGHGFVAKKIINKKKVEQPNARNIMHSATWQRDNIEVPALCPSTHPRMVGQDQETCGG